MTGQQLDDYVKKQVTDYREQAKAFGLAIIAEAMMTIGYLLRVSGCCSVSPGYSSLADQARIQL